ncbi:MAG TPA: hypothetical protein PKK70_03600 [Candidatus Paceibacterota bacterium]|nr:hypothetical protein [Candidatus Paceibacterota bacterium]
MKTKINLFAICIMMLIVIVGCTKTDKKTEDDIIYSSVNKEYVLHRDIQTIKSSDDEISNHVDSILSGLINEEFISTGYKTYDLNNDNSRDIGFEIINIQPYNNNDMPDSLDSLAARVQPLGIQILDNSTWGYCDALNRDDKISDAGYWTDKHCVIGTFTDAGQFKGKGEKYLAFRLPNNSDYNYGWIRIYCSEHNDTLRIIDYAYNKTAGNSINAGQGE